MRATHWDILWLNEPQRIYGLWGGKVSYMFVSFQEPFHLPFSNNRYPLPSTI